MASRRRCPINKKYVVILEALYHFNDDQRRALLRRADVRLVKYICECALNILHGNVPLTKREKDRLEKHAAVLRKLVSSTSRFKSKRALLVKRCKILTLLLAPLVKNILSSR